MKGKGRKSNGPGRGVARGLSAGGEGGVVTEVGVAWEQVRCRFGGMEKLSTVLLGRVRLGGTRAALLGLVGLSFCAGCGQSDQAAFKPEANEPAVAATKPDEVAGLRSEVSRRRADGLAALLAERRAPADGGEGGAVGKFFEEWAEEDWAAARAAAATLSDFGARLAAHAALLRELLAKDPAAALAWLRGLQPKEMVEVLVDEALADWAGVDAAGAGEYVAELAASDYRTVLAGELARAWAAKDGAGAMAWGAGLQDQEAREEALTEAVHTVAATDARAAAELALKIPHEAARADALELAVIAWWERDPAAVAAWATGIVDAELRIQATRLVAAQREAAGR